MPYATWKGYLNSEGIIPKLSAARKKMTSKQKNEIAKIDEERCVNEGTQLEYQELGCLPSSGLSPSPSVQGVTSPGFGVFPWSLIWRGKSHSPTA